VEAQAEEETVLDGDVTKEGMSWVGTVRAESMDVDEVESHAEPAEEHEAVISTASEMVTVTPPDTEWTSDESSVTDDARVSQL
jgi:hypothetical protein